LLMPDILEGKKTLPCYQNAAGATAVWGVQSGVCSATALAEARQLLFLTRPGAYFSFAT